MSKWTLLKAAITGKNDRKDEGRDISIHRFLGFTVIPKRKIIWQGFQLNVIIEPEDLISIGNATIRMGTDASTTQTLCWSTSAKRDIATSALKEESCSLKNMERFKEFITNSYGFLSAIDCKECLLVINSVDSISNIDMLERIIMDNVARTEFRRQSLSIEFAPEHSATTGDRMMLLRGAYYIYNSLLGSSKSCQYFVYDLPICSREAEALKVEEGSREEDHQINLSVSSPLLASSKEEKISSPVQIIQETNNTSEVSIKNLTTHSIIPINGSISKNIDETINVNGVCEVRDSSKKLVKKQEQDQELDLSLDDEIVYRMSRIFTREESPSRKVSGSGLLSHLIHGVDNTGDYYGTFYCGVVWCGVVWCGVVLSCVVWCGVLCCGVVWCVVVWCGVLLCFVLCSVLCFVFCYVLCFVVFCHIEFHFFILRYIF